MEERGATISEHGWSKPRHLKSHPSKSHRPRRHSHLSLPRTNPRGLRAPSQTRGSPCSPTPPLLPIGFCPIGISPSLFLSLTPTGRPKNFPYPRPEHHDWRFPCARGTRNRFAASGVYPGLLAGFLGCFQRKIKPAAILWDFLFPSESVECRLLLLREKKAFFFFRVIVVNYNNEQWTTNNTSTDSLPAQILTHSSLPNAPTICILLPKHKHAYPLSFLSIGRDIPTC